MSEGFLIGLDAGGGGGRCLVIDVASGEATTAHRAWSHATAPGTNGLGVDLDLPRIWSCLGDATREAMARAGAAPERVLGIAASSMRQSVVVLDADGNALYAGPNRDARAIAQGMGMMAEHGEALHALGGHWPLPVFAAPRLQWLRDNDPDAWSRATHFLSLSDWIAFRLCGVRATDASQAGESLVLDVASRTWAWEWIERFALRRDLFPEILPSGQTLGSLGDEAAAALGLAPGTPVAVGGADSQCGTLGAGAARPGAVAAIAGTTTPVQLVLDGAKIDSEARVWTAPHVVPDRWVLESNAGPAGQALEWLAGVMFADDPRPAVRFLAEAGQSDVGAAGLLSSFGADVMNARDVGLPTGSLTLSHLIAEGDPARRQHVARAVIEGMVYALRGNLEQLQALAPGNVAPLRLAGGLARSDTFRRLVGDVLGSSVRIAGTPEASALGAALCAGVCAGVWPDLTAAADAVDAAGRDQAHDAERASRYQELYTRWDALRTGHPEGDAARRGALTLAAMSQAPADAAAAASGAPIRMLVTADMDREALARLEALGEVEYASYRDAMRLLTGSTLAEALAGFDVFVCEIDVVDAEALTQLPDLRVVASCRGDAVNVDVPACTALGIPVLNAPGRNALAVADLTLAFLLMLARKLQPAAAFLRQPGGRAGDMGRMGQAHGAFQGRELWRKRVGLIGLGAVGREVARRLQGFGAEVVVADPFVSEEQAALCGARKLELDELLATSDFVSLHAPVTPDTSGLIDADALARMQPGACLVNTARAALVDEEALAAALERGQLAGAAVDVFSVEPPGPDHALLQRPEVIGTPHLGGNTVDVAAHQGAIICDELERLLRGERPRFALNAEVLDDFDWTRPRPELDPATLAALAQGPGPAVSDLQRDEKDEKKSPQKTAEPAPVPKETPVSTPAPVPQETRDAVDAVLDGFLAGCDGDAALGAAAAGKDVTLHFRLSDLGNEFWLRLRDGTCRAGAGAPDAEAEVELSMRAYVFDGMFTGRVNAMQSAMNGELSFSGDTAKAMTLQAIQGDLARLYQAARDAAGDPGDLKALPDPNAGPEAGAAGGAAADDDPRHEMLAVINELYSIQVITATGGNVSMRIPGTDELWMTPSQLFKGDLRPEVLVRVDLDGKKLDAAARSPSSERLMHCAVYKERPEAQAVIHAHAPHATILANSGLPFLPISTEAAFFDELPRIPFVMPGTQDLADAVGEAMRGSWAVLMQNHGLLVAGRSLRRAADMVEIIERSAEIILGCYAVGKEPPVLPADVVAQLRKMGDLVA